MQPARWRLAAALVLALPWFASSCARGGAARGAGQPTAVQSAGLLPDSATAVASAERILRSLNPGAALRVAGFRRDSAGVVITLVPAKDSLSLGGWGVFRVSRDGRVRAVHIGQ